MCSRKVSVEKERDDSCLTTLSWNASVAIIVTGIIFKDHAGQLPEEASHLQ
jgi:hypothetical protein